MGWNYVAFTSSGQRVAGSIDAPDEDEAEHALWAWDYRIVTLRYRRPRPRLDELFPTFFGVKRAEVIGFARQMSTLLDSGITVFAALELLQRQASPGLRRVLGDLAQAVEGGAQFSDALRGHEQTFPPLFSQMVSVGERTGELGTVMRQLAAHLEREQAIIKRVRGALAYPAFILVLAVVVVAILMTTALPPLVSLFDDFGGELPIPTRILIAVGGFVAEFKLHAAAALALAVVIAALYVRRPEGRRQLDAALLRLPRVGSIIVLSNAARFSSTTSILLRAGIPISEVVELAIDATGNRIVRARLRTVQSEMLAGEGLAVPLARAKVFPPVLVQMVEVGEETGTLDATLETVAELYTGEVDAQVSTLTAMIQPALLLGVGAIVGFVALSVVMPMYGLLQDVQQP